MNSREFQKTAAVVLAGLALLTLIIIIAGASGVRDGLGAFLVSSFHLASLYIPVFLLVCAYALLAEKSQKLIAGLNLSVFPFLTLTALLHVLSGNREILLSRILIDQAGTLVSSLFLLVLLSVESALVYKLANLFFPDYSWFPRLPVEIASLNKSVKKLRKGFDLNRRSFSGASDKAPTEMPETKEDEIPREAFPFPDLPSPIDPIPDTDDSEIQSLISSVLKPESCRDLRTDEKENSREAKAFNPEKTLSICDVVDKDTSDPEDLPPIEQDEEIPMPVSDPGIDFLINEDQKAVPDKPVFELMNEPVFEDVSEEPVPEEPVLRVFSEEPEELEELEEPEDIDEDTDVQILSSTEEADDDAYEEAGYMGDRIEDLDPWRSSAADGEVDNLVEEEFPQESHSVEDKLSPEGETEKLGTISKGMPPRHHRKKSYKVPVSGLLKEYPDNGFDQIDEDTRRAARALEETLQEFNIDAKVSGISKGPVITMFEIQPAPGVKVSRIVNLQDNLALRLAASRIRIVAPIPGKQAIGIEVPNKKRAIVSFSELVSSDDYGEGDYEIPVILGKDISGKNQVIDLARTPHLLIAGSTGSGKSVCVNSLICSILFKKSPQDVKLMMVDPKIVELKLYNDIPHLLTPVITEPKRAFQAVQWCLYEMERRYSLLDAMGVRDIKSYNKRIKERDIATTKLPYIVLVIDEFADLMATSGKELEGIVARLAAMSRAVGIHLVLATQRPSIDVITGLIKANFPSRIAFMVASKTDSRIIIDMMGAEKLLGKGDMLFTSAWDPFPSRMQGSFLSEDEVERVVSYVKTLGEPEYIDDEIFLDDEDEYTSGGGGGDSSFSDPLYNKSLEIVMQAGKASASYLQRRLKIGYNRAARLVEEMEIQGIVGPQNGSKPREILHIPDNPGSRMLNDEE